MFEGFRVRSAETGDEVARVADLIEAVFGGGREYILGHPDVRLPQALRYVEHKGNAVAAHVLEWMELSLGSGWATAMRIEYVCTAEDFRQRGLCRLLIEDSLRELKASGVQLAAVFGEPLFRKLGFEYCVPTYEQDAPVYSPPGSSTIPIPGLAKFEGVNRVDDMELDDLPHLVAMHEAGNPKGNLSRRRSMAYWEYLVRDKGMASYQVVRSSATVGGYFRVKSSSGEVQVREVVAQTDEACQAILHATYGRARSVGAEAAVFHCPHDGVFGSYLGQHGAAEYSPYAERLTNLQLKVLDVPGCLKLLTQQLSARLARSELAGLTGHYELATEDGSSVLVVREGRVKVAESGHDAQRISIPARILAQLVCGFCPGGVAGRHQLPDEHARLLEVLFPPMEPYWYVDDL